METKNYIRDVAASRVTAVAAALKSTVAAAAFIDCSVPESISGRDGDPRKMTSLQSLLSRSDEPWRPCGSFFPLYSTVVLVPTCEKQPGGPLSSCPRQRCPQTVPLRDGRPTTVLETRCQTPPTRRRCQTPPRPAAVPNTSRPAAVQNVCLVFSAKRRLQLDSAHRRHQRWSHHRENRRCRVTR